MAADLISRARAGDEDAFAELVDSFRPELLVHCYRILGSLHAAEDGLQESLIAAWQGLASFEGRASMRTWLYRIATNRCLNLLRAESRRPATAAEVPGPELLPKPTRLGEVVWLEPLPDRLFAGMIDPAPGPDTRYELRESVSLAFVTALQLLPPRQRAVLILRDVLGYQATEVARMLESTEESVTSALKRARATLERKRAAGALGESTPSMRAEREVVERFVRAFESHDLDGIISLLTSDVRLSMPPLPFEWQGQEMAREVMIAIAFPGRRLLATRANGQPAFALYLPDPQTNVLRAAAMLVLTLAADRIAAITQFDKGVLRFFDLPPTLSE